MKFLLVFFLLLKRFPFDWKHPIGYLSVSILEYIIMGYEFLLNASTLGLGIGTFWIAVSVTKELQRKLYSINDKAQSNGTQIQTNEMKVSFTQFIDAHVTIKQFSIFQSLQQLKKRQSLTISTNSVRIIFHGLSFFIPKKKSYFSIAFG